MKCIKLHRYLSTGKAVYGRMEWENGECYTMEHLPRPKKKQFATGIPAGCYFLNYRMSKTHNRKMPFLDSVPGFRGIMIHTGNTLLDTHGCILVGDVADTALNQILFSRRAFRRFMQWFVPQWEQGEEIVINVYNEYEKEYEK
jgi:hypothetical protein